MNEFGQPLEKNNIVNFDPRAAETESLEVGHARDAKYRHSGDAAVVDDGEVSQLCQVSKVFNRQIGDGRGKLTR